ncbi:MAG: MBL fold metallo-hydrolase [Chitinispirillales bacterium]|nr:MBL fold metallo-hydrolase [Chitinispirillales bacterium]
MRYGERVLYSRRYQGGGYKKRALYARRYQGGYGKRALRATPLHALLLMLCLCTQPFDEADSFTFSVADVGQGLAQFGVKDGRAVLWDMGLPNQYSAWRGVYEKLGKPDIVSIVISHSDADHLGGLQYLDHSIKWNGVVAVSPFEDTVKIRAAAGVWASRVRFEIYAKGDTMRTLSDVEIICLWPPKEIELDLPLDGSLRNRYSLVFSLRHGHCRGLITSDIDSTAMMTIAAQSGYGLASQILVAPHHGSAGSVNQLFFSYTSARTAVISCARQNNYGHPSQEMLNHLIIGGTDLLFTYLDGTITFVSNGHYWSNNID